jgi:hypothetical protein
MGWLTTKGPYVQDDKPNKKLTLSNQLYYDSKYNKLYLVPRLLLTDDYTMPFGINKNKWDVRASHLHDIGCKFHQVIVVDLPLDTIEKEYLCKFLGVLCCKDIPIEYLHIEDITFNNCNSLFKRCMRDSGIPSYIYNLYRLGVNFNIGWLFSGKDKLDLNKLYIDKIDTK